MEQTQIKKIVFLLLVVVVVVGAGYLIARQGFNNNQSSNGNQNNQGQVKTSHVDLASASSPDKKIPEGFPKDIPVETDVITESYSAERDGTTVKQYSVSFYSTRTTEQKFALYKDYMSANLYNFSEQNAVPSVKYLYGKKGNNDLSVMITAQPGGRTYVQLSYYQR